MIWEEYEQSGQHYTDQVNKMLSKMAVCERYLPTVTVNGQEAKLTGVQNRHGKLYFFFMSPDTTYQANLTTGNLETVGHVVAILRMSDNEWQSDEARRIHDAVYEQYCQHA